MGNKWATLGVVLIVYSVNIILGLLTSAGFIATMTVSNLAAIFVILVAIYFKD